ncbi:MAG: ROK family protein [Ruminococcaceae bacterium]|nr:ROK family protein [Oscillospiraceae bacterium]
MKLGVDIGGTEIKFGVVNDGFEVVEKYSVSTPKESGDAVVAAIIENSVALGKKYSLEGIGIGTPGILDAAAGVVVYASNLPFENIDIVSPVSAATGLPVKLGNDASCAMLGELYAGYGREYDDILMVTLGTGVGGGIIIGKKPYFGKNGSAGEFGHMVVVANGEPCGCGRRGCFERYASVSALISITEKAIAENPESLLAKFGAEKVNGRTSFDAMRAGCPVAAEVVEEYISNIAVGVESLIMIFQPELIVFGGAISNEGEALLAPLRKKVSDNVLLACSRLKNDAGFIGAAAQLIAD